MSKSKKFKDQMCIYCLENLSTRQGDHIFARKFFLKSKRDDLPKVPACKSCNDEKSQLEHYLTTVLPFGGQHSDARDNLQKMVPPRLAKNEKLRDELERNKQTIWEQKESGLYLKKAAGFHLPEIRDTLESLICFIVTGLLWYHWKVALTSDHGLLPMCLTKAGEDIFDKLLSVPTANRVESDLGNGTFFYRGDQNTVYPELSIWEISVYGGLRLADVNAPHVESLKIGAFSCCRKSILMQTLAPLGLTAEN